MEGIRKKNHNFFDNKVTEELEALKNTLVNSVLIAISVIGLPSLIIAISASRFSGNFPIISTTAYLGIVGLMLFSKRLPLWLKTWPILLFGYFIGTSGLITEGLLSDGFLYYIILSVLSSMLLGTLAGVITMIFCMLNAGIIALAYQKGMLNIDFNVENYLVSSSVWMSFILVVLLFTSLILIVSHRINAFLLNIIRNLSNQTVDLNLAKKELEKEIQHSRVIENSLTKSERKFQNIFNRIQDGIIIFTKDNLLIDANQSFLRMTGFDRKILDKYSLSFVFEDFDAVKDMLFEEGSNQPYIYDTEIYLKTRDQDVHIPVEVTTMPFHEHDPGLFLAVLRDISSKKESEKLVLNAIIQTEETERTRISQDLHDSLGPLLSAVKLYSNSLPDASKDEKRADISNKINELMDEAISTVKEISNNLSSHILNSFGLYEAIESFSEKIKSTYPVKILTEFDPRVEISETIQVTLYRVIVELINNTLKYASARKIKISTAMLKNKVVLLYRDDGTGFDADKEIREKRGMGLFNIHSRIKSLGGTVTIQSGEGKGTHVKIVL